MGGRFEENVGRMPSGWRGSERVVSVSEKMSVKCLRDDVGAKAVERPSHKTLAGKRLLRLHNGVPLGN